MLLHFKADVMLTDGIGNTPLHLCVDNGHEDVSFILSLTQAEIVTFMYHRSRFIKGGGGLIKWQWDMDLVARIKTLS